MSDIDTKEQPEKANAPEKLRSIRSFVRREGRITAAQRRALDELLPALDIYSNANGKKLGEYFAKPQQPLCIEIGFGNGDALVAMAQTRPDWNFVGAEVYRPGVGKLLLGVEKLALTNVRVTTEDAVTFFTERVTANSLDAVYVFFPDPWPKKKHLKRRLINHGFIAMVYTRLKPGGCLHIATDVDSYAEQINELLALEPRLLRRRQNIQFDLTGKVPARPSTKYENRGRRLGHRIHDIVRYKTA